MTVVRLDIASSADLYEARRAIGELARSLGFSSTEEVKICTAVSEIVRNVLLYATRGGVSARKTSAGIAVEVWDQGPGIPLSTLAEIEEGTYKSKTGLGKGIGGAKRLMDRLSILSVGNGTQVFMEKHLRER